MGLLPQHRLPASLLLSVALAAAGCAASLPACAQQRTLPFSQLLLDPGIHPGTANVAQLSAEQQLLRFRSSDAKFSVQTLMDILQDHRHEGWVLAAYPDPKTHRPLIGAGFSLDLEERLHPQQDLLNDHAFLEPSSAELWQAAGLQPAALQSILEQYTRSLAAPAPRRRHRRPRPVTPQLTDAEAGRLLRIAVIQAIYNAKAYCRDFDRLSAPQQMALTQLVYQMGVNLEEFSQFLGILNDDAAASQLTLGPKVYEAEHWNAAQQALVESQWARVYRTRAVSVIAMLDPAYGKDPEAAEARISAQLPPPVVHESRSRFTSQLRTVSYKKRGHARGRSKAARSRRSA